MSIEKEKFISKRKELIGKELIKRFDEIENSLENMLNETEKEESEESYYYRTSRGDDSDTSIEGYLESEFELLDHDGAPSIDLNHERMLLCSDGRSFVSGKDYNFFKPEKTKKKLEESIGEFSEKRRELKKKEKEIKEKEKEIKKLLEKFP